MTVLANIKFHVDPGPVRRSKDQNFSPLRTCQLLGGGLKCQYLVSVGFDTIVTIVVWSDFLRNKTDRKLTAMSQT